jgi:aspartokinase
MITMKFGGTSVGDVDAFAQVIQIVAAAVEEQKQSARPGVVV